MTIIYIAGLALILFWLFGRAIGNGLKPILIVLFALWVIGSLFGPSKDGPAEQQTATTAP